MRARQPNPVNLVSETIIMDGGFNENSASLELKGGELIYVSNYVLLQGSGGGYRSTKGYERFDGRALASTIPLDYDAQDPELDRENHRDTILEVPGSGDILGIHMYRTDVYALRNNAGDTATDMYKSTPTGWELQDLGARLAFTAGSTADFTIGETVTGGTSGATGVVGKLMISSGTFAGNNAVGYIIITGQTGTFQAETITGGTSTGTATIAADSVPNTITKDGKYHFFNNNFLATAGSEKMFFVNGVNKAMCWDGNCLDFIDNAGMDPVDTPEVLTCHNERLFLAYEGGSLQYSTIGDPEDWTTSPGEFGVGKEITSLLQTVGNALVVFCENGTKILQGSADSSTWEMQNFAERTGANEFTPYEMFGTIMYMNDQGVSTLDAVQSFGDFQANTMSQNVYRTIQSLKTLVTTATIHRDQNQYRVWFNQGAQGVGVVFSFKGARFRGATVLEFPDPVVHAVVGRDSEGTEEVYFTSTNNGYVFKMESGTSFDGSNISCRLLTAYYHYGSPLDWKRYISASLEVSCLSDLEFFYRFYFDYGDPHIPKSEERDYSLIAAVDEWGEEEWAKMVWSAGNLTNRIKPYIHGLAANAALGLGIVDRIAEPHTIQNMTVSFEKLRRQL